MPDTPRIEPLADEDFSDAVREVLDPLKAMGGGRTLNIFRTLAHHPDLMRRWLVFGNHVLGKSTLPAREREIAILRIGWLCRSAYEWGQHVLIARGIGMTDAEISRIAAGADAEGLDRGRSPRHPRHRRAARRRPHRRRHLGRPERPLRPPTAHGPGLRRRSVQPGLDGPQHLRRRPGPGRPRLRRDDLSGGRRGQALAPG